MRVTTVRQEQSGSQTLNGKDKPPGSFPEKGRGITAAKGLQGNVVSSVTLLTPVSWEG